MAPIVVALGHRFKDLSVEREVLGPRADLVDATQLSDQATVLSEAAAVLIGTQASIGGVELDQLERCKVIVRYGIGADNIDLDAAATRGIGVANVPDYCLDEVSDHAMAMLLAAARRLDGASASARAGSWTATAMAETRRLSTQLLGLVGYGRIGRMVAMKARAFGIRVLVYDPYSMPNAIDAEGVRSTDLEDLLARADFVSLHCPLTPETKGIMNAARIASMKKGAWLINTSRGGLVVIPDLLAALDAGTIAGASLDVLPEEPAGADHPAILHPKVTVTPHVAWYSQDAVRELRQRATQTVALVLDGGWPSSILNGVAAPRVTAEASA